ncbi:hypothetical protein, partial [Salinivibrio sp. IB643]|uniref:hypothetical protein n=1 Tax=Salinivibrio sp. IB643 TaxID=1909445 RepID=UPI001A7E1619
KGWVCLWIVSHASIALPFSGIYNKNQDDVVLKPFCFVAMSTLALAGCTTKVGCVCGSSVTHRLLYRSAEFTTKTRMMLC